MTTTKTRGRTIRQTTPPLTTAKKKGLLSTALKAHKEMESFRMKYDRSTVALRKAIFTARDAGVPLNEIATTLGISRQRVSQLASATS